LASRSYNNHTVSATQPPAPQVGDEWYNPTTNKLYKWVATSGTTSQWAEVFNTTTANTFSVSNLLISNVATFTGSTTGPALVTNNIAETVSVSTAGIFGVVNFNVTSQTVFYYTGNSTANWIINLRASDTTTLNSIMAVGQSISAVVLATNGATAYYPTAVWVDGVAVTPKWQGGTAPTTGNGTAIDSYTFTVVKTAAATFTVFASQTKFA
jgi:hypothetical protein